MADDNAPDEVLGQLVSLGNEARAAEEAFKTLDPTAMDVATLTGQVADLFAFVADMAAFNARAHTEHFTWAEGVDEDLDELKDPSSALVPEDAARLKSLLTDLLGALPLPMPEELRSRVAEAIGFIDEITLEETETDPEEQDEE
jgi:hypothetical protein